MTLFYDQPHYSGQRSELIWRAINGHKDNRELYEIGCAIQESESILRRLEKVLLDRLNDDPATVRRMRP